MRAGPEGTLAEYAQITDRKLEERIRARYLQQIGAIEALGFRRPVFCLEALGPYSLILNFPILLLAYRREVFVRLRPMRLAVGNVLLFHDDPPAVALCMGYGVKIYSELPDQTLLISSDFRTAAQPLPGVRIVRMSPYASIEEAWKAHRERASLAFSQARFAPRRPDFHRYVEMSRREEDLSQYV
jgi:hypothetical protein